MSWSATTTSSATGSPAAGSEAGRWRPDPRLPAYLVGGFGALIAAIVSGHNELAALGAPFIALAAIGQDKKSNTSTSLFNHTF